MERKVGELLDLLSLSASAKDEETACEGNTDEDENDESDKKFHHSWGHGGAGATRAISKDESWDDGHLEASVGGNTDELMSVFGIGCCNESGGRITVVALLESEFEVSLSVKSDC